MPDLNINLPQVGVPHSTEDPKTRAALVSIKNLFNGQLDDDNLADGAVTANKISDALAESLGINKTGNAGRAYATVATSQSTSSTSYVDLSTVGPSVTVDVPANGFVYVYAEVTCTGVASGGAIVGLYEATDYATPLTLLGKSGTGSAVMATVPGSSAGVDKTTAAGGFLQLPATAGSRTYTLKYVRVGGSGSVTFAARKLWVISGGVA